MTLLLLIIKFIYYVINNCEMEEREDEESTTLIFTIDNIDDISKDLITNALVKKLWVDDKDELIDKITGYLQPMIDCIKDDEDYGTDRVNCDNLTIEMSLIPIDGGVTQHIY